MVDNEIEDSAEELYNEMLIEGHSPDTIKILAQQKLNQINASIYEQAIENYIKSLKSQ